MAAWLLLRGLAAAATLAGAAAAAIPHVAAASAWYNISLGGRGGASPCALPAACIFDASRCESRPGGQCWMLETEAEAKCGAWDHCTGVVCRADYKGYCLARGKMTTAAAPNMWGYTKSQQLSPPPPPPAPRSHTPGATVQNNLTDAIKGQNASFQLPAGDITFNHSDFLISAAAHMVISGSPDTTLWFDAGYGLRVFSCINVTIRSATIDYWVLPYVQATVTSVGPSVASSSNTTSAPCNTTNCTSYQLQLAPRSATPESIIPLLNLANPGHFWKVPPPEVPGHAADISKAMISGTVSSCGVPGSAGPFPTGLKPCAPVNFTRKIWTGNTSHEILGHFSITIPPIAGAAVGDQVTFKAGKGHTFVVGNCSGVRTEQLIIRAAGWMVRQPHSKACMQNQSPSDAHSPLPSIFQS